MTHSLIVLDDVPGMTEALHAVQLVGGVLLAPEAAQQLVVAAWYAAEPVARAAAFADAADLLAEAAHAVAGGDVAVQAILAAANLLDVISYEMRRSQ